MVGGRCGMERLHRFVRSFGFGDITGVGLPGEHTGMVQDFSRWNPSFSPQSIPIGQEIAITPIQIVTAFSVFCNGGVLLRPRVVRGIIGPDGATLADYSRPIAVRRVLEEATAEMFRQRALVETVTDGTGKSAKLDEYQVFGKTGTAQVARPGGHGYLPGKYVGSFVGGAPSDNPRAVVLVSIYKPSKEGYYGGTVAAPAVKEILAETLAYMQVPPELAAEVNSNRGAPAKRR
jgi:cell division protein FtsI/penicillin-binding protein 2